MDTHTTVHQAVTHPEDILREDTQEVDSHREVASLQPVTHQVDSQEAQAASVQAQASDHQDSVDLQLAASQDQALVISVVQVQDSVAQDQELHSAAQALDSEDKDQASEEVCFRENLLKKIYKSAKNHKKKF